MAVADHPIAGSGVPTLSQRAIRALPVLAAMGIVAIAIAMMLYRLPLPGPALILGGGVALVGITALAVGRYDMAVALGFLTLGVVKVEPAPTDLIFGVVIAVCIATGRFDLTRVPFAVLWAVTAYVTFAILSIMEAIEIGLAAKYLAITAYLAMLSMWLCIYVNSAQRSRLVVLCWLAAAVSSALLGSAAYIVGFPGSDGFLYGVGIFDEGVRVKGLFEDANVYAPFLIPMVLIMLEETLQPRLVRLRLAIKVACLFILMLGVALAFSRAAYANLVIGIMVLLIVLTLRRGGAKQAGILFGIVVVAFVALALTFNATGSTEFLQQRSQLQRYDTGRFGAQREGIELAQKHPVGIGPGQFELVSPVSTHSTYIRVLAEHGFMGFITFTALAVITLMLAIRNAIRGWHTYGIGSAALLAAWIGLLANSFVIDSIHWRHLWVLAGLIWAGSAAGVLRSYEESNRGQLRDGAATTGSSILERRPLM